jgi:hypothetical protein
MLPHTTPPKSGAFSRLRYPLLRGCQFPTFDTGASQRRAYVRRWWFVQASIAIELAHRGEVATVLTAKPRRLAGAVTCVAYEDEVAVRKPAHQARQQQPGDVRWRLMTPPMQTIPLGVTGQGRQDGERPHGRVANGNLTSTDTTTHLCPSDKP